MGRWILGQHTWSNLFAPTGCPWSYTSQYFLWGKSVCVVGGGGECQKTKNVCAVNFLYQAHHLKMVGIKI